MPSPAKQAAAFATFERIQNETTSQTLTDSTAKSILHRLIISNTSTADGTLTILDGASITLIVLQIPKFASAVIRPMQLDFNIRVVNDIRLNPSVAGIDCLAIYSI